MTTVLGELQRGWDYVSTIEPALGDVSREELRRVEDAIAAVAARTGQLAELDDEDLANAESGLAVLYARAAAIAIAAGEEGLAQRWFDDGAVHAGDGPYREQFA